MRKLLLLSIVTALLVPSLAFAGWQPARKALKKKGRSPGAFVVRDARPPPAQPRPAPAAPRGRGGTTWVAGVEPAPFWLGWSWGWGYYPLWPRPYYEGGEPSYLPDDARRLTARLDAYGAGAGHAAAGTLAITMEGPMAGFNADVTALAPADPTGTSTNPALTLSSARATWSIASEAEYRLRLELGGSMLSIPSAGIYEGMSYANTVTFGPQVGVSGHLGLVGPLGLEGHARVTPYPVPVLDARAAVVLRGGPLAVSAGWRSIDVNGDGVDAPEAHFAGPELGLQLVF
jgi:hypothetical protein